MKALYINLKNYEEINNCYSLSSVSFRIHDGDLTQNNGVLIVVRQLISDKIPTTQHLLSDTFYNRRMNEKVQFLVNAGSTYLDIPITCVSPRCSMYLCVRAFMQDSRAQQRVQLTAILSRPMLRARYDHRLSRYRSYHS